MYKIDAIADQQQSDNTVKLNDGFLFYIDIVMTR
jgi:hypothetical protein